MNCSYFNPVNLGVDSWAFASSTCDPVSVSVSVSPASTSPAIANGFTYGEIINGFFLLLTLIVLSVVAFHLHFGRIKIKN
jgi:hypothetical protein